MLRAAYYRSEHFMFEDTDNSEAFPSLGCPLLKISSLGPFASAWLHNPPLWVIVICIKSEAQDGGK